MILLCTEEERIIEIYTNLLKDYMNEDFVCLTSDEAGNVCKFPCTTLTRLSDIWKWFYDYANKNYEIDKADSLSRFLVLIKVFTTREMHSRRPEQTLKRSIRYWETGITPFR